MRNDQSWHRMARVGAWLVVWAFGAFAVGSSVAARPESKSPRRATLAITYGEGSSTTIEMVGSPLRSGIHGRADVSRHDVQGQVLPGRGAPRRDETARFIRKAQARLRTEADLRVAALEQLLVTPVRRRFTSVEQTGLREQ